MKKIFYFVFILLLFSANVYAQRERLIIHEFSKTPQVSESDFNTAKNAIIAAFDASNRFEILNAEQQALIDQESKNRDEGNAIYSIDSNTGDIKTKSNRYALSAAVTACEVTKKDYEGGSTFSCFFAYTVSIVDMEENSTVVTKTFKHTPPSAVGGAIETLLPGLGNAAGRIAGEANTPEKAKSNVFKKIEKDIIKLVNDEFPLKGHIFAEDYEVKKDQIVKCFINIGEIHGVNKGNKFTVQESRLRVGSILVEEIGELKVEAVHNEVAECKITKGGKEVMKAMERYIQNLDDDPENAYPLKVVIKK